MVQHVVLVHPDRAGLERVRNSDGRVEVLGVHRRGEAIGRDVAEADRVGLVRELGDGAHGAEDFLFHDLHVLAHMGEYRRLDEIARLTVTFATNLDFGAFLLTGLNVSRANLARAGGDEDNYHRRTYPMIRSY